MNNKNISLFNYVYSSTFETEKNDDLKWSEFKNICLDKMNYLPYDFIIIMLYFSCRVNFFIIKTLKKRDLIISFGSVKSNGVFKKRPFLFPQTI